MTEPYCGRCCDSGWLLVDFADNGEARYLPCPEGCQPPIPAVCTAPTRPHPLRTSMFNQPRINSVPPRCARDWGNGHRCTDIADHVGGHTCACSGRVIGPPHWIPPVDHNDDVYADEEGTS